MAVKSIRKEIRNLALITVLVALFITFSFGAFYKITKERNKAISEFNTLAEITSLNSQSALAFNDRNVSAETLNALTPHEGIIDAAIVTVSGEVLAYKAFDRLSAINSYSIKLTEVISKSIEAMFAIKPRLEIEQPVFLDGRYLGEVKLTIDTSMIWHEIIWSIASSIFAMLVALLFSLLLMHRMIKHIMQPIDLLINSAKNIASSGRYSLRVDKMENDELGMLTDQFNLMIEEVQKRDQDLLSKNDVLEVEVHNRTMVLKNTIVELKHSEFRWKFAIEGSGDGVWDWNIETHHAQYSKRWKEMLGYHDDDILPTHDEWVSRVHPDDKSYVENTMQTYLAGKTEIYVVEYRLRCKDDSYKWILGRGMVVTRSEDGEPLRMIGTHTDITERRQAEQQLRIAATAFESQEGMMVTDADCIILRVNNAFTNITGYAADEVVGQTPRLLHSGHQNAEIYEDMWSEIKKIGEWEGEIVNRRKNGEIYPEHLTITAVKDINGIVTNYVATLTDITNAKAASAKIENLAFYDPLTNLPNRRLFVDRLTQAIANSSRSGGNGALLFLDLDHFKTLNDTLGHDYGDLLLQQVAERLIRCVREGDTVARIGGDEFVLLLEDLSEHVIEAASQIESIGEKIIATLNQPYQLYTHEYQSTASIGVALFSDKNHSQDDLLKHADIAMYQAKKAGRNTLRFFDPHMQDAINIRVDMERELNKAIARQQFELHYQIQVNSVGQALGAEALIRWNHPERGLVTPFNFIPLAEETGQILQIGQWVLETACAQIKIWQSDPITKDLTLSVNVSAKQFLLEGFAEQVLETVQRHHINPARLKLELTESLLLDNIEQIIATMSALKKFGIQFSLDDFGTGYSSLQYLKTLPLNQLKIDQSFVRDLATDHSDKAIVLTIITMAHSLRLEVIAEGVETEEQRQFLTENGCLNYQGYLFSKPVPIDVFEALLRNG